MNHSISKYTPEVVLLNEYFIPDLSKIIFSYSKDWFEHLNNYHTTLQKSIANNTQCENDGPEYICDLLIMSNGIYINKSFAFFCYE